MEMFQFRTDTHFQFSKKHISGNKAWRWKERKCMERINEDPYPFMLRSLQPLLKIDRGMAIGIRLVVVMALLCVSQLGCVSQTLQETDRHIAQAFPLGNAIQSAKGSQRPSLQPAHPTLTPKTSSGNEAANVAGPLTLERLERLAQEHNPTLIQARTQIEGERAKALQAGLYPNPLIGYSGEQIGVNGTAGEFHGRFVQQEIVTAGKLRLSREKYLARASAAEFQALAQEYRVINEVRIRYYQVLGAQERLGIQQELLKNAEDALVTVEEQVNLGQANRADLHQAKVLLGEQHLNVNMAENALEMEWEWLMSIVGMPQPRKDVPGTLEGQTDPIQWDTALQRLLAENPELELARAILKADEITVEREKVQPIPNLVLQGSAGRNYETRETVYGFGAFIELPIFDRNQGTIRQAQADLRRQQVELRLTKLRLRRSLATQFQRYRTALQQVDTYRKILLPESQERYRIRLKSYGKNRQAWPAVLEAQQDFFERRLLYIDHLVTWRSTQVAIDGLLLVDGLVPPRGVTLPGHIDAVPKPR
jgi:outer membrane protein TolC